MNGVLERIQVWVYSGQDRDAAFAALHRAYRYMTREFDSVHIHGGALGKELTQEELVALLPVEFKTEMKADGIERMMKEGQIQPRAVKAHLHPGVEVTGPMSTAP